MCKLFRSGTTFLYEFVEHLTQEKDTTNYHIEMKKTVEINNKRLIFRGSQTPLQSNISETSGVLVEK